MSSSERPDVDMLEAIFRLPSETQPRRSRWPAVRTLVALGALAALVAWIVVQSQPAQIDMLQGLPRDGLVAADAGAPEVGGRWVVTSGSLLTRNGELWSGRPDAGPPDPAHGRTGSAVLRAVSTHLDFENVRVSIEMALTALVTTTRTSAHAWDGVHIFLRYQNAADLYVVDLTRRDGTLAIKRKRSVAAGPSPSTSVGPGVLATQDADLSNGGLYTTLATTRHSLSHEWHRYELSCTNGPQGVTITLSVDGNVLLTAVDPDTSALRGPGGVGLRGDNANFKIRKFIIEPEP